MIPRICFFLILVWLVILTVFVGKICQILPSDHTRIEDLAGIVQGLEREIGQHLAGGK